MRSSRSSFSRQRRLEEPWWNEFVPQLSSTHNSKRSTQLNSTPNSTQLSLSHQLNLQFNFTPVATPFNSANYSTQLNSNQLTTQLNAIRNSIQLNRTQRNATRNTTQLNSARCAESLRTCRYSTSQSPNTAWWHPSLPSISFLLALPLTCLCTQPHARLPWERCSSASG